MPHGIPLLPHRVQRIIALWDGGTPITEIAKKMRLPRITVAKRIERERWRRVDGWGIEGKR